MIHLNVDRGIIDWVNAQFAGGLNLGRRGIGDGSSEQQRLGLIAQAVVSIALGCGYPSMGEKSDGGYDFLVGKTKVDVKALQRERPSLPEYVHNLVAYQVEFEVDIYVFCEIPKNQKEVRIAGWITPSDLKRKAEFIPANTERPRADGSRRLPRQYAQYEVEQRFLNEVYSIPALYETLKSIKEWV
jgi:hypothetical protein